MERKEFIINKVNEGHTPHAAEQMWIESRDGWYKMLNNYVYTEKGYVMRGMPFDGSRTLYPYRWNRRTKTWDNVSGRYKYDYFRLAIRRGNVILK